MRLIGLTTKTIGLIQSEPIYIDREKIVYIQPARQGGTIVGFGPGDNFFIVKESLEEVRKALI